MVIWSVEDRPRMKIATWVAARRGFDSAPLVNKFTRAP
jgi:hypothetical protein